MDEDGFLTPQEWAQIRKDQDARLQGQILMEMDRREQERKNFNLGEAFVQLLTTCWKNIDKLDGIDRDKSSRLMSEYQAVAQSAQKKDAKGMYLLARWLESGYEIAVSGRCIQAFYAKRDQYPFGVFKNSYGSDVTPGKEIGYGDGYPYGVPPCKFVVHKDVAKAIELYEEAAKQNFVDAFVRLGELYYAGEIVAKNIDTALYYYGLAAEKNNYVAMLWLGIYYKSVSKSKTDENAVKSFQLFERCARQYPKNEDGLYYLGNAYYTGYGVKRKRKEARKLFKESAYRGNVAAKKRVRAHKAFVATVSILLVMSIAATCLLCGFVHSKDYSEGYFSQMYPTAYILEGDHVYFGYYPQTIKTDEVKIKAALFNGYYLGDDGALYVKKRAKKESSSEEGYYFKVEPIRWDIFNEANGRATIVCDLAIDSQQFDYGKSCSNNYADSTIRAWLNGTFYNTAFNDQQKGLILTTTVDNSVASTGYSSNGYACANTSDKVFLLSYAEATTYYASDAARQKGSTDYAKAQGCLASTSSGYVGNCYWWLRSPDYSNCDYARVVYYDGCINYYFYYVDSTFSGVVCALTISLS